VCPITGTAKRVMTLDYPLNLVKSKLTEKDLAANSKCPQGLKKGWLGREFNVS
jgi:hypothetical protein